MKLENYKIMKCPECNENVIYCINKDMSYNFDILKKLNVTLNENNKYTMPCDCSPESKLIETDILHLNENDYAMLLRDMLKMNDMHNITEIGYSLLDTMKKSGFSEIQRTIFIKNMVLDYEKIFQF